MNKKKGHLDKQDTNQKKKVLFLLEAFDKGGIEKVTLDIVNNLDPQKYDITVQTFWYGGTCQSQVHDNIRVIPFFFKRYVRGIIRLIELLPPKLLYRLFVHGRYDVEIAASDGGAAKVISGSTNNDAKKICWVHMDVMARGSKLKEFQDRQSAAKIYRKFDKIVCVSEACKEKFSEKFGSYPIDVVYNPLPIAEIQQKADADCPHSAETDEKFRFVCIGRLVEQKGFDRLLNACKRLHNAGYNNFIISILGEGPERSNLEKMIENDNLDKTVFLPGFSENPYCQLKQADAFLLSSRDESFSLVVGESLIVGTPVIATDCCGIREWLRDNQYGLIVENSEDGIFDGMRTILEQPELLKKYRNRIPERVKEISFESALKRFEQILR